MELALAREESATPDGRAQRWAGSVVLPAIGRTDHLALLVRLHCDGEWWYHPEPQTLLQLSAHLNGLDVHCEAVPRSRSYNGPGAPWVAHDIVAGSAWTGQALQIALRAQLPPGIAFHLDAYRYEPWWLRQAKRFKAYQ